METQDRRESGDLRARGAARLLLLAGGWISLALGAIGLLLPVVPTTPFLLLAAWFFLRSSRRLHEWLVTHSVFGPDLTTYLEGRGIRRRAKRNALLLLWTGIAVSAVFLVPVWWVDTLLLLTASLVTVHLVRLPTAPDEGPSHRAR